MRSFIPFLVVLIGCSASINREIVFEEYKLVDGDRWYSDSTYSMTFEANDSLTGYDFYFNLRYSKGYEWSNLYTFVITEFPDGRSAVDTVECILFDRRGKPVGSEFVNSAAGTIMDASYLFKVNRRFPMSGKYNFVIRHAMRTEVLDGIYDVGIKLEKTRFSGK